MRAGAARSTGKILVGRLEISGYYRQLSAGLTTLGVAHDYVTYWQNPFGFGGESHQPKLIVLSRRFPSFTQSRKRALPKRLLTAFVREVLITTWGLAAVFKYDAFIFGFGETLLRRNVDLVLIRLLGKPAIVNMGHGSEARPPYMDGSALLEGEEPEVQARRLALLTKQTSRRVRRIERWATYVIGAPYSNSQFARKPFINHFAIGIPYSQATLDSFSAAGSGEPRRNSFRPPSILHSPSNPSVKGTVEIEKTLRELSDMGFEFDYKLIKGQPNAEVLKALQNCDLVIDQLYSDTPLAGFATEAAWMGRPSLVGGYALTEIADFIPAEMFPPSVTCVPEDLKMTLISLLENPQQHFDLGREAKRFVMDKWNAKDVASRYMSLVSRQVPPDWWVEPTTVCYVQGMGLSRMQLRSVVHGIVHYQGVKSLQLNHRPDLLQLLLSES